MYVATSRAFGSELGTLAATFSLAMALAMTLLIAPAAVHRLTFGGRDEDRMHAIGSALSPR